MSNGRQIISDENVTSHQSIQERAEKNRQKALLLRKSKLVSYPYTQRNNKNVCEKLLPEQRLVDSGGGFLIEDDNDLEEEMLKITTEPAPIITELPHCEECQKEFKDSYLYQTFDLSVCDACRDNGDKHSLITKTEAKQEYLLKDCDFDKREPPLKYIVRKNPHNARWGEMKLYLQLQVEQRALEVWGTEENLLKEKDKRDLKKEVNKVKDFNKKMKKLRMEVRSSLYDRTQKKPHVHNFGKEEYNESDDTYTHTCCTCGYVETYEKM